MWDKSIMTMMVMVMVMVVVTMEDEGSVTSSDVHFLRDDDVIMKDDEKRVKIKNIKPGPLLPDETWKTEDERRPEKGKNRRRRNTIEEEEDKMRNMIARPEVEIVTPKEGWKMEKEKEEKEGNIILKEDSNTIEERWMEEDRRAHKDRKQRRRRRRKWRNKKGRKYYRRNRTYGVKKKTKDGGHVSRYRLRNSPNQRPPWMVVQSYRSLDPRRVKVRRHLVRQHNLLRAKVEPPAGDMLTMKWYKTAAEQAQSWAEQCEHHSHTEHPSVRWTSSYGACGQNVFLSPTKKRWSDVLQHWWDSNRYFAYDGTNNNTLVAAYTQMAWYNSHQLGCGFSQCHTTGGTTFFRYVCNYCPTGNDPTRLSRPYTIGSSCSRCPGSCRSLCPRRRCPLCTNACTYSDLWVNCRTLDQEWHEWLCNTKTKQGVERFKNCRATCQCVNEIT